MIRRAVWWAVGGFIVCIAFQVSLMWSLIILIATAVIGAL
jgi:low affinity Fe/Cu permease